MVQKTVYVLNYECASRESRNCQRIFRSLGLLCSVIPFLRGHALQDEGSGSVTSMPKPNEDALRMEK